jgi:membrane protease YdiL (CAAX protease family)
MGVTVGCIAAGAVFGIFHFAVYGTSVNALLVVTISGIILSYIAVYTQSITPGIIAHSANNFISSMNVHLSILAPNTPLNYCLIIAVTASICMVMMYQKRRSLLKCI